MPTLVLLAGPNGAGKTTFNDRFLRRRVLERLDALSDARAQIKRGSLAEAGMAEKSANFRAWGGLGEVKV